MTILKSFMLGSAAVAGLIVAAAPAQAVNVPANSTGLGFDIFDPTTRGTQLAVLNTPGASATISAIFRTAVYRNLGGTLDFYYQTTRTGGLSAVGGINAEFFNGFTIDAFTDAAAPSPFVAPNNPPAPGNPAGSTTTIGRSPSGNTVRIEFGLNNLVGNESSTTYILRTNALAFTPGFATVTDGQSINFAAFQPSAIPEPATWGLMIVGFGLVGASMRNRRRTAVAF